jgi:hypothetical protein
MVGLGDLGEAMIDALPTHCRFQQARFRRPRSFGGGCPLAPVRAPPRRNVSTGLRF